MKKKTRIRVQEVVEAYEGTGLRPCTGAIYKRDETGAEYACGFGALAVQALGERWEKRKAERTVDELGGMLWDWVHEQYEEMFVNGFWRGFDGAGSQLWERILPHAYGEGRRTGARARRVLNERGLLKEEGREEVETC